jgi:hypothetical protein
VAKQNRSRTQAKKDARALKLLRAKGLYTGKFDARKKPSKYQQNLIKKFDAVLKGRAAVVKPKNAAQFRKSAYQVIGGKVIVPRKKGERVFIGKSGDIRKVRRDGGLTVRTKVVPRAVEKEIERPTKLTMYFVPFNRGGGQIEWRRFTYDALKKFQSEYGERAKKRKKGRADFREWMNLIEKEELTFKGAKRAAAFKKKHDALIFGEAVERDEE